MDAWAKQKKEKMQVNRILVYMHVGEGGRGGVGKEVVGEESFKRVGEVWEGKVDTTGSVDKDRRRDGRWSKRMG